MLERGHGRIVNVASGAAYLPGSSGTSYSASKAAVHRFSETLANQREGRIPVFSISPGLVRTSLTDEFGDDAPWTPPELAPRLVRALASGRLDALAGRYLGDAGLCLANQVMVALGRHRPLRDPGVVAGGCKIGCLTGGG